MEMGSDKLKLLSMVRNWIFMLPMVKNDKLLKNW
jgi:hypothetical protein